ncbi:MAG: hypothetical protein WB538_20855, partial [Candidatus Sulfotelmatobacter sp.]
WGGDGFVFYDGYWGPNVGFYGGINYGFGYFGVGFEGGRWDNGHFFYNRSVSNVDITNIHNVYNTPVTNRNESHVSYNGGNGGISARPTSEEESAARDRHIPPVAAQTQHAQAARANPQERASVNMGRPGVAATPRPGDFNDRGAVPAKEAGAPYTPANRGGNQGNNASTAVHPHELPPLARSTPNTGNPKLDKKYQQQQDKQIAKQQQERDKLQQKQDQEHVQLDKQKANDAQKQQVEQKHQQQTQQLQQKHQQQTQQLQQRQQPANREPSKR